jgi:trehalose 6-phosphate phosphatase
VAKLLQHAPFSERAPIFIGDDETDEDVMGMLREFGGVGYGVGREMPGTAFTFESPAQVRSWLERLARG